MKADIPDRTYFKIGEVASILGVKPHIVRYWAAEFPQIRLQKTKSGQRLFRRRDIEMLLAIDTLVNEQEYTVSGAKSRLKELRALGVKNKHLRGTIQRIASVELLKRMVLDDGHGGDSQSEQPHDPSSESAGRLRGQETLGFLDESEPSKISDAWKEERSGLLEQQVAQTQCIEELEHALRRAKEKDGDAVEALTRVQELEQRLKQDRDAYERRIALYKKSVVEERRFFADEQNILTLYIEELEELLHQARESGEQRAQELQQNLKQEADAYERRIALYQESVVEERQFFADEQNILTLYIEELEESLFEQTEANRAGIQKLNALNTHTETLRTHVRTHAMQRRYALRKLARDAKQHNEAHAHARALARRLLDRVQAQRLLTGHETRDDSD